jgi:hypothetical protein
MTILIGPSQKNKTMEAPYNRIFYFEVGVPLLCPLLQKPSEQL